MDAMLFSGLGFLFRFLPIFFLLYLLTPPRYRSISLFFGSLIYYAALEPHFVFGLFCLTLLNWLFAKPKSRVSMIALAALDVGVLAAAKMIVQTQSLPQLSALPIGLSFYLLKMITFQVDLKRGNIEEKPSFFDTASYFVMFPQLLQGPIMRYGQQFSVDAGGEDALYLPGGRRIDAAKAEDGFMLLMSGLVMKVLLADQLAAFFVQLQRIGYESISTPLAWLGIYGYSFQLYYDFWGYSLMAAGLLMMLGYPYIENFRHPYGAKSVSDFYRRWHISLGTFFRDYVYIPLGGSKKGRVRCFFNLLFVWALTGLWHGTGTGYLIWALFLFLVICWEKFAIANFLKKVPIWGRLHVFLLIPISWIIFAIPDSRDLGAYLLRLFPLWQIEGNVNPEDWIRLFVPCIPQFLLSVVCLIPKVSEFFVFRRDRFWVKALLFVLFWIAIYRISISSSNPFLYLQF